LRLRLDSEHIPLLMPLAGKSISIQGSTMTLGAPELQMLLPGPTLWVRMLTLHFKSTAWDEARTQLLQHLHAEYPVVEWDVRRARTIRIHGKQILGFEVLAASVSDGDSLRLQREGFGGRRAFGCGIFVRVGEKARA